MADTFLWGTGTATHVNVFAHNLSATSGPIKVGIYDAAGNLIAETDPFTSTDGAWHKAPLSSTLAITSGTAVTLRFRSQALPEAR